MEECFIAGHPGMDLPVPWDILTSSIYSELGKYGDVGAIFVLKLILIQCGNYKRSQME